MINCAVSAKFTYLSIFSEFHSQWESPSECVKWIMSSVVEICPIVHSPLNFQSEIRTSLSQLVQVK